MKKNLFYYLFAVICTIGLFTSCSDDDEKVVNPIPQTTFMANVDNVEKSVRTVDVGAILQQAIAELYPMLINGVPLTYTKEGNRMKVFLGTDLLLPLMKNIVAPLFEDEEFLNMVIEAMKSDPQFGGMAGMMVPTLKLLPEIIKNTTQLEIGLDLTQVK